MQPPNTYKAVFIDLDGTLLSPAGTVTSRTQRALKALVSKGVHVVFATGRPIESVRKLLEGVAPHSPVITLSGSVIHHSLFGEIYEQSFIPADTVVEILAVLSKAEGLENLLLDEADGFHALKSQPEIQEFIGLYGKEPIPFQFGEIPKQPVLSILVHAKAEREAIYDTLLEDFGADVHFTYFKEYPWIEISRLHCNKGRALESVCHLLGINPSETIAIGDAANDLEMVTAAGLGVAMENADAEIKQVADKVILNHAEEGVALFLEQTFALF